MISSNVDAMREALHYHSAVVPPPPVDDQYALVDGELRLVLYRYIQVDGGWHPIRVVWGDEAPLRIDSVMNADAPIFRPGHQWMAPTDATAGGDPVGHDSRDRPRSPRPEADEARNLEEEIEQFLGVPDAIDLSDVEPVRAVHRC